MATATRQHTNDGRHLKCIARRPSHVTIPQSKTECNAITVTGLSELRHAPKRLRSVRTRGQSSPSQSGFPPTASRRKGAQLRCSRRRRGAPPENMTRQAHRAEIRLIRQRASEGGKSGVRSGQPANIGARSRRFGEAFPSKMRQFPPHAPRHAISPAGFRGKFRETQPIEE